jgi:hypothetical protein
MGRHKNKFIVRSKTIKEWRTLPSPIDSRWNFLCRQPSQIIVQFHMESRQNPGEIQMDHVEFHSLHPLDTGNFIFHLDSWQQFVFVGCSV